MKEKLNLGIDFGTSNSSVGSFANKELKLYNLGKGHLTQPSSIYIRADGYHSTGEDALIDFQGDHKNKDNYHFIPSLKTGLHMRGYDGNALRSKYQEGGRFKVHTFDVDELASYIISDLKTKAESESGLSSEHVILGRPVFFSTDIELDKLAEDRLTRAAKLAGFKSVNFMVEPIAAALYYERTRKSSESKRIFVFDFGGGTLDTCIIELPSRSSVSQLVNSTTKVVASHGIDLGGKDLDKQVFVYKYFDYLGKKATFGDQHLPMPSYIYADLPEWHLSEHLSDPKILDVLRQIAGDPKCTDRDGIKRLLTMIKEQQVFELLQSIEKAKIETASKGVGKIVHNYGNINIDDELTLEEFENYIITSKRLVKECIDECLNKAGLSASDVDLVLKVGGSSCNPFVERLLKATFNNVENTELFTSVVAGLSMAAYDIY